MEAKPGMIVRAKAGREEGRFMAVTSVKDGYVYLADGKERKLAAPKKKNIKHVAFTKAEIQLDNLTDKGLRSFLREYTGNE